MARSSDPGRRLVAAALAATVLAAVLLAVMNAAVIPILRDHAGGLDPFDLRFSGYTPEQAREYLGALGGDGRRLYASVQIPLDLVFPAALAAASVLWIFVCRRTIGIRALGAAAVVPITAAVFDYTENFLVLRMLGVFPDVPDGLASAANLASVTKGTAVSVSIVLVAGLGVAAVVRGASKRRRKHRDK